MKRSDSSRVRPRSTRDTAPLWLSILISPKTPPKCSSPSTIDSKKACCVQRATTRTKTRPE